MTLALREWMVSEQQGKSLEYFIVRRKKLCGVIFHNLDFLQSAECFQQAWNIKRKVLV
jgi:hypothetical protein